MTTLPTLPRWAPQNFVWGFPISANYSWVESYATTSLRSVDISIGVDVEDSKPPFFFFTSPHLNHLPPDQAQGRAAALILLLNGLLCLQSGPSFHPFSLGSCIDLENQADKSVPDYKVPKMSPFPEDHQNLRYTEHHIRRLSGDGQILLTARYDRHVRHMLEFFGIEGLTFASLYKALDTMKDAGYKEKRLATLVNEKITDPIEKEKAIKKVESNINDFRFTANTFQAAGHEARHGLSPEVTTKARALTIEEASKIMSPIILNFIHDRVRNQFSALVSPLIVTTASNKPGQALPRYDEK